MHGEAAGCEPVDRSASSSTCIFPSTIIPPELIRIRLLGFAFVILSRPSRVAGDSNVNLMEIVRELGSVRKPSLAFIRTD